MSPVTVEMVQDAAKLRGLRPWRLRDCSICHAPLRYVFTADGLHVGFDGSCDCVSYYSPPQEWAWSDLADIFTMQDDAVGAKMWADFAKVGP